VGGGQANVGVWGGMGWGGVVGRQRTAVLKRDEDLLNTRSGCRVPRQPDAVGGCERELPFFFVAKLVGGTPSCPASRPCLPLDRRACSSHRALLAQVDKPTDRAIGTLPTTLSRSAQVDVAAHTANPHPTVEALVATSARRQSTVVC
jgi:hypothetical protein